MQDSELIDMAEDKNITKTPSPMDYWALRDYGLDYIRKVASRNWTDLSVHDPGVTILEALTLAVSDLSYRSSASMADLLTRKGGRQVSLEGTMFPADVILANAPTTAEDYRKIMLENIPGIRNIWFVPVTRTVKVPRIPKRLAPGTVDVRGGYKVIVELENLSSSIFNNERILSVIGRLSDGSRANHLRSDNYRELYSQAIQRLFLEHRNLCETIQEITFLNQVEVGLCAEIEIDSGIDMRSLLQEIYDRMYDYISPTIPFHTVEELLSRGREAQDIFDVRPPRLGYIDREELASFDKRKALYVSDVIAFLMDIPGIRSVHRIHFLVGDVPGGEHVDMDEHGRTLSMSPDAGVSFSLVSDFMRSGAKLKKGAFVNSIVFNINGLTFLPPSPDRMTGMSVTPRKDERVPLQGFRTSMPVPKGLYRATDRYFSFQNLLPETYRMGVDSLPESASTLRKAERMQLKAYLTFFDQLLADYLAQLDHFQDLLSVKSGDSGSNDTYFHGKLTDDDITDVSKVLIGYPDYVVPQDDPDDNLRRKNEVLDHLLTRFSESFAEYASLEFIRNRASDRSVLRETVEDKKRFLGDYPRISSLRSCGLDWSGEDQVTGVERRIMRRLGIDDPDSRGRLSEKNELSLYMIEHSLLAPWSTEDGFLELAVGEGEKELLQDPYTFRVTAVLPAWTDLAANLDFRKYAEKIIREETPAHIFVKVCWISREAMAAFEDAYAVWREVMKDGLLPFADGLARSDWDTRRSEATARLVSVFRLFTNVYPEVQLVGADVHEFDDREGLIKLDASYLGTGFEPEPDTDTKPAQQE